MLSFFPVFLALLLDRWMGEPAGLWTRLPHPVVIMGKSIFWCSKRFNTEAASPAAKKRRGILCLISLIIVWGGGTILILSLLPTWASWLVTLLGGAILIAHRSLVEHVQAVMDGLTTHGLEGGRTAVAMIVGRDPTSLDEAGVCRAAIESTAENFSDGVIAPVFWFVVAGLPGLVIYKLVNTADSMIGHRTDEYRDFGWASARLDDLINLPASRLTALLIITTAWLDRTSDAPHALLAWRRDAHQHKSPNAGHPEAAMAGALGLALAGPRQYGAEVVHDPYMNAEGRHDITPQDIQRALNIINGAWLITAAALLFASLGLFV